MADQQGQIVCHFCGGCATSLAGKVMTKVADLGDGFANIKFNYIDTSRISYDKLTDPRGDLFLIETKDHGAKNIHGAGGDRHGRARDIMLNVPDYLNKSKILTTDPSIYHAVFFSASGGSGGVIASLVIKALLEKNIPVICVAVGDSSNGMYTINTLNTLASLNKIALNANKPLSIIYVNNSNFSKQGGLASAENAANQYLLVTLSGLSLFLAGRHGELDNQDMLNFIDQSKYATISVRPGLYGVHIYSKEVNLPDGATPTGARILTVGEQDFSVNPSILHFKRGIVSNENALAIIKEDQFPLYMINYANFFALEDKILRPLTENAYNVADNIVNAQVAGSSRSDVDEETGLIL